ncbi:MAG TPA: XdhC family protein [Streptosporangiaceae bacterium]|nr:XdhC family protein [Streptosporangiaceae bacterium]
MNSWEVMEHAAELARRGEAFALATVVWRQGPSSSQQGSRAIITADGELDGWIGGACAEPAVVRAARHVIATGSAELLLLGNPDQFGGAVPDGVAVIPVSCQSEGALEVYIEPVVPVPCLVVVGRSPMAQTLASLAEALGWHAELIDGADFTAACADERSLVVVATQGHDDEGVLEHAVAARPAYLGLVGSRKRGEAVLGYLADRGVPKADLDRVTVPAGLDLGSTTHPEIAVAILAELVQLRASGALAGAAAAAGNTGVPASFSEGTGPHAASRHSERAQGHVEEATDPVCGMTVSAGPDALQLEYAGVSYYFCCAGCRQAFDADPAAHAKRLLR